MRIVLLALLVAAVPAAAQSAFVRGAGPYVSLSGLDPVRLGDGAVSLGAGLGWRVGNGVDVDVAVGAEHTTFDEPERTLLSARRLALALRLGYTAWLGDRVGVRMGVRGALQQTLEVGAPTYVRQGGAVAVIDRGNRDVNVGGARLESSAFVRVPVGGVALQPTAGLFVGGLVTATADAERPFTLRADSGRGIGRQNRADAWSGVSASVPVLFRAAGLDLAVDPAAEVDVRGEVGVSLSVRANL